MRGSQTIEEVRVGLTWKLVAAAALGCAVVSAAGPARADENKKKEEKREEAREEHAGHEGHERLPVSYTERPITLPRFILNPELEFAFERFAFGGIEAENAIALALSARFGITDDLDAYAIVAPLEFGPIGAAGEKVQARYVDPKFGATYRFMRGKFELGATLGITIVNDVAASVSVPVALDKAGVILEPGAVGKLHINKQMSLEAAAYVPIQIGSTVGAGLRVPIKFAYDIMEPLHVGAQTGVGLVSFAPPGARALDGLYIPLGIFAGYAIQGKEGPVLDIDPFFTWPALLTPGVETGGTCRNCASQVNAGYISVGVSIGGFLYL
jgi:hypothetical protein